MPQLTGPFDSNKYIYIHRQKPIADVREYVQNSDTYYAGWRSALG